ncbi:MAG TPA: DinB family protein [Acidimicrobiales bacterium]|nr:DinB family protein [Acidimicrobiales bacterium]
MNADAERLAGEFEAANDEVIAFVEACPDERWTSMVGGEDWPVGVVVHHIAVGHRQMLDWLRRASGGHEITTSAAQIDADNARHARHFAGVTRAATVEELRSHGAALGRFIRGLSSDELATSVAFGPGDGSEVTTRQLASVAARHCRTHLADARPSGRVRGHLTGH